MFTVAQVISSFVMTIITIGLLFYYANKYKRRYNVTDKVVLITGACGENGLGINLAALFKSYGAKTLIITSRSEETGLKGLNLLDCVEGPGQAVHATLDLNWSVEKIEHFVHELWTRFGKIDIVVANAGVSYRGEILKTSDNVFRNIMQSNFFGNVCLLNSAAKLMKETNSDMDFYIVGISSVQGRISIPYRSAYSASKHAFSAYLDCLRAELNSYDANIKVLCVSPSYINTNLSRNAIRDTEEKHSQMDKNTETGMKPEIAGSYILSAIRRGDDELLLLDCKSRIAMWLRIIWPSLYFLIMNKRAKNSRPY